MSLMTRRSGASAIHFRTLPPCTSPIAAPPNDLGNEVILFSEKLRVLRKAARYSFVRDVTACVTQDIESKHPGPSDGRVWQPVLD